MKKIKYSSGLLFTLLAAVLMVAQGCSRSRTGLNNSSSTEDGSLADSARLVSGRRSSEDLPGTGSGRNSARRLSYSDIERMLVFFDFDKYRIRPDMRLTMDRVAQFLLENPRVRIQVEGHSDERGTPDYNIALGHKRAQSVKSYLLNLGVSASRMQTVSYGEERPLATGRNEAGWGKNRRAKFNIISGSRGRRN